MKKKIFGRILLGLLVIFLLAQFIPRPEKNNGEIETVAYIGNTHAINPDAEKILQNNCFDCHSNKTNYPWYASIQPVAWWLGDHINEGQKELNFSEFGSLPLARQFHKLEEIEEEVAAGEMPLESYTVIHRSSILTAEEKAILVNWSKAAREDMRNKYPADSLVMKKK
jgi:hypothetical protein